MTEQTGVAVALVGQLEICRGEARATEAELGVGQARLVFAVLVRERGRAVARHELAEVLWPGDLPDTWASALRSLVSKVRSFLTAAGIPADALVSVGGCYQLRLDPATVDLEVAERRVAHAADALADGRAQDAVAEARAAVATLSQPLLAGIDNPWLDGWRSQLTDGAVRAAEIAATAALAAGDIGAAIEAAQQAVAHAPFRESAYRLLMQAHDAAGNRAEALRIYERCRAMLVDALGVSPDPGTEALYLSLLGSEPDAELSPDEPAQRAPTAGTVTFLFSDIEGSAALWEQSPEAMSEALATHDALMREAVERHGGRIFKHTGDGMCAVFPGARESLLAAVDAQRAVRAAEADADGTKVRVRMGVHTGEAEAREDDFAGVALNRVGRLCALAHGGQVLVSSSTRLVVEGRLPAELDLVAMGDVQLRGFAAPEAVYQLSADDLIRDFPALVTADSRTVAVVAEDGPLVGRDDDLALVAAALGQGRLVTITGPGGVGKTRLALAAANRADAISPARVWWVELAAVDGAAVADAVAGVVGGDQGAGLDALQSLLATVSAAPAVIILDNCEHVLDDVGRLVQDLLNGAPDLRVLATSRVALGLSVERLVTLAPLATPDESAGLPDIADCASVAMFMDRARAASPRFEITEANAREVAEICRRLDGLPLAIELAAARVHSIPPAEIVGHLDERLRLLRRTRRDRSGRHRSLEEALRWSYDLLTADEQRAFNRLSVFGGSFTPAAASAITGVGDTLDVLDLLDGLAERSMVVAVAADGEARYRVLETLAEFGRLQLEESDDAAAVLDAHRRHYLALVEAAAPGLRGRDEPRWVRVLNGDFADVRAVFTRSVAANDVDTALRLVVALFDYAFYRMRREIGQWAAMAATMPGAGAHPLHHEATAVAGYLAWERGDVADATRFTAVALTGSPSWVAEDSLATLELFRGKVDEAIAAYERAAAIARAAGDDFLHAIALSQQAFACVLAGRDDALELIVEAEPLAQSSVSPTAIAQVAWSKSTVLFDRAPRAALECAEQAIAIGATVDNRMAVGAATTTAEELRTKLINRPVASDLDAALEQVEYWMTMGNSPNLWLTMRRIARNFVGLGVFDAAALAFAAEAEAASKLPMRVGERDRHEAAVSRTSQALGPDEFARLTARGAAMSPDDLIAELRSAAASIPAGE